MRSLSLLLLCLCLSLPSCAKAPAGLPPTAVTDWNTLQIGHDLDLIRDIVHAGATLAPPATPVFTRDVDVKVATWHKAAVLTLVARSEGWKVSIQTGLDQVLAALSAKDRERLLPYATLIKAILASS